MTEIQILCADERLSHMLTLLLSDEYLIGKGTHPSLVITDNEKATAALAPTPVLLIGKAPLSRPFSHLTLKSAVRAALSKDGSSLLTPTEKRLFDALRAASPAPVSRESLIRAAFGDEGDDRLLNLYIHYLRKKLEADGKKRIFACRGKGYYYHAVDTCR